MTELWGQGGVVKGKPLRERPADFDAMADELRSYTKLIEHYRCGPMTLKRWLNGRSMAYPVELGSKPPADFAEKAARMLQTELCKHYGASDNKVRRWIKLTGATPLTRTRAAPGDFAEVAPTMTKTALVAHYHAVPKTINRWLEETGVRPMAQVRIPPRGILRQSLGRPHSVGVRNVSWSIYDQAVDTLQRNRWAVYRCNDRGLADPKGKFWRVGMVVCDADELLARAARYRQAA